MRKLSISNFNIFGVVATLHRNRSLKVKSRRKAAPTVFLVLSALASCLLAVEAEPPPNILFCISDDQSWAHMGANGDPVVKTPAFDRVANEGLRFINSF